MASPRARSLGSSTVFRVEDRVQDPSQYTSVYAASFVGSRPAAGTAAAATVDVGVHITYGTDAPSYDTEARDNLRRYDSQVYLERTPSVDPSAAGGALGAATTTKLMNGDGTLREESRVKSCIDLGHDGVDMSLTATRDAFRPFVPGRDGCPAPQTAAERLAGTLAINTAKFELGYDPRETESTAHAADRHVAEALAASGGVAGFKRSLGSGAGATAGPVARSPHFAPGTSIQLGTTEENLSTTNSSTFVRHPHAAYTSDRARPVKPGIIAPGPSAPPAGSEGEDAASPSPSGLARTILVAPDGKQRTTGRVASAIDIGHDDAPYVTAAMESSGTTDVSLTRMGGWRKNVVPYVPTLAPRYMKNHPAIDEMRRDGSLPPSRPESQGAAPGAPSGTFTRQQATRTGPAAAPPVPAAAVVPKLPIRA